MTANIEQGFQLVASHVALGVELAAILAVGIGAIEAIAHSIRHLVLERYATKNRRMIWVRFATWILLSLEFALGADIIRTAISPSWDDIGKLAAIATIRTALNFFLGRDVKEAMELPSTQN